MSNRKVFLEIGNNYIKEYNTGSSVKFRQWGLKSEVEIKDCRPLDAIKIDRAMSKNKVYFIYAGEELFIKLLELPHLRLSIINEMIISELKYLFKEVYDLSYSYKVLKRKKNALSILLYCVSSSNNKILLDYSLRVRGIYLIQLCILDIIQSSNNSEDSISVILYNNDLYMISCLQKKIVGSTFIKEYNGSKTDFYRNLQYVLDGYKKMQSYFDTQKEIKIYFVNFNSKEIIEELSETYSCEDKGKISIEDVLINLF